jgi:hypothetical protein
MGDRHHLVSLYRPHQPARQLHFAVVEAESLIVSADKTSFVYQGEYPGFDLAPGLDVGDELRALQASEGILVDRRGKGTPVAG